MSQRVGTGLIIMQAYTPGSDPDAGHEIVYLAGKWEFTPGVVLTDIMGPLGAVARKVPSEVKPQLTIEAMEAATIIERSRLHGTKADIAAAAMVDVRYVGSFQVGDSLLDRSALVTQAAALAPAAGAREGLYEIQIEAPGTLTAVRRVWPAPVTVGNTDAFMAAPDAGDFFVTSPASGDTASIFVAVEPIHDGAGYSVDFTKPAVEHVRVTCTSDFDLGDSFMQLEADPCVAVEPVITSERAAVNNLATTYDVLGGQARVSQVQYARAVAGTV